MNAQKLTNTIYIKKKNIDDQDEVLFIKIYLK